MALPTDQGLPVPAARTPPAGALACAFGSGTLPHAPVVRRVNGVAALFVRRINGFAARPRPAARTPPVGALACAPGSGTLPPHPAAAPCRHLAAKKNLKLCAKQLEVKKFPAPCYSPIVNYTVPSPLEPLTTVFGKGTCVSAPLSAPEKITIKKISPGIISKIQSSRLPTSVESTFFSALHAEL